jgi:hypothetical protein
MIEALSFQQASPKLVPQQAISAGIPNGAVLQLWIRRNADQKRTPIVELAGADSRIVLGTGDRPDILSLAMIAGGKTTEITVPGALPMQRWVQVRAVVRTNGAAELHVLGMKLASGMLLIPGSQARTLMIGGLAAELALLQVWKHSTPPQLTYDPPSDLAAQYLWAFYPLAALEWDATRKQNLVKDVGPNQRHAVLQGTTGLPTRVVHDEPLDRGQAAHLRFVSNDRATSLGPLIGLSGQLTLEAWVCPTGDSSTPVFNLYSTTHGQLVLVAGGPDGELALLAYGSAGLSVVARATGLVQRNQWSHVAVTVEVGLVKKSSTDATMVPQLNIGLFHQGQLRKRELTSPIVHPEARRAAAIVKQAMLPAVELAGPVPTYARFRGGMAEVRIWSRATQERVEALWLARARGDEDQLLACYRLDTDPSQALVDISPRRGFASTPGGISLAREQCPPLAASSGPLAFRVLARGKLLRERLPKTIVGSSIPNISLDTSNATHEERRVFHVTIDVATRSGNSPLGRTLDVRLDQPLTLLQVDGSKLVQTAWAANKTQSIPLPTSGCVRLRFAAQQLACPTIRVRVAGTPGCVWTIVRPDEMVQAQLRNATVESLKSPTDGRRSPLPAGTSDADTQALVNALGQLGTQFVREPTASSHTSESGASTRFLGIEEAIVDTYEDGVELAEDTYEDGADLFQDTAEATVEWAKHTAEDGYRDVASGGQAIISAGQDVLAGALSVVTSAGTLIMSGGAELEALVNKTRDVSVWVGRQTLTTAIKGADQVAFVSSQTYGSAASWVEVIGTSIVDGTEVAWRVVVSGIEDALAAVTQLIERIGAQIQEWIDYLAWLFMWDDFLAASDDAYEIIKQAMRGAGQQIAGLGGLANQITDALRETVEDAIGKRSLADVFEIDIDAVSPAFEQLDYVQEKLGELLESTDLSWGSSTSTLAAATGVGLSQAVKTQAGELDQLQPFGDPSDVLGFLTKPISELLAGNGQLADGSPSLLGAVFDPITASATEMIEQLDAAMFSRLSVPYLTDFIESVVLCGRTLSIARIMALMAAIPAVLAEKISGGSSGDSSSGSSGTEAKTQITTTSTSEADQDEQDRQAADQRTRWALWVVMGGGLVNTILITGKSVAERRSTPDSKLISFLQMMSGSIGFIRGVILAGRVPAFPACTRPYASVNASAEIAAGLCATFFGMQGLKKLGPFDTRKDWSTFETVIQTMLGVLVIGMSIKALFSGDLGDDRSKTAFGLRCGSWVLSLSVRVCEKLDDRDTTSKLKYVTMGLAVLAVVTDVTEAIYGNIGETEEQT